jgi:hypothetical protein
LQGLAVDPDPTVVHGDELPRQADDALDVLHVRIARVAEDDHLAPLDAARPRQEGIDDDVLPAVEGGLHAGPLHLEGADGVVYGAQRRQDEEQVDGFTQEQAAPHGSRSG